MIRFECDYAEGAHDRILDKLVNTNYDQTAGYGEDEYTERAKGYIRKLCGNENADVHLMVGGTQTNLTVISSVLRPHQGVISAETGHINVHETGAIEATGHKVITIATVDGKISADQVRETYYNHWNDPTHEHIVQPGMVYISHPTENGTTYSRREIADLSSVCRELNLPLYMDGARLGYGLASDENDLRISDISKFCDVFYIGGTKVGALFGEAVVIMKDSLKKDFRYFIKQKGGLLAKGRLLGIQFEELFKDGLYMDISKKAVKMALMIKDECVNLGYEFLYDSVTNQQFPILTDSIIEKLQKKYAFYIWQKVDEEHSAVRFCTSWATKLENVKMLVEDIRSFHYEEALVIEYENKYSKELKEINHKWLKKYDLWEAVDDFYLDNPIENVVEKGGKIFLAKDCLSGQIVGTVMIVPIDEKSAEICKLSVLEEFQGKGIGKMLFRKSIDEIRKMEFEKIILYSNHKLKRALKMYEKFGFSKIKDQNEKYEVSDIKMELNIFK